MVPIKKSHVSTAHEHEVVGILVSVDKYEGL